MSKKIVDITFQESIHFDGILKNTSIEIPIENVKIDVSKYHYLEEMRFNAYFQLSDRSALRTINKENGGKFNISGKKNSEIPICAKAYWTNQEGNLISGVVTELQIECETLKNMPGRQYIYANLSSTNLSLPEVKHLVFHWTGEIKPMEWDDEERQDPFVFNTKLGEAKFSLHYDFESTDTGEPNLDVRIPKTVIGVEITEDLCKKDVKTIIEEFKKEIKSIEFILSFFSRRQVRWYEINLVSDKFENKEKLYQSRLIRQGFSTPEPLYRFVNPYRFTNKTNMGDVVELFKESPYKEPIEHTINYLNGVWDDRTIESIITTSFTAFETIINGVSDIDNNIDIIDDDHFKAIRKKIESTIKAYCLDNKFDGDVRSELYRKLPEIQRSAIIPRSLAILERYGISYHDIIKNEDTLEKWLRDVYSQRSLLIHTGRVPNLFKLGREAYRIHALTERLVYELVGGKKEWLDPMAYGYLKNNRGQTPISS